MSPKAVIQIDQTARSVVVKEPAGSFARWVRRSIPTGLVLLTLSAIGFWGHHNNWRIPKFSALMGGAVQPAADWCETHGVPESQCVECDGALVTSQLEVGWCQTHGLHQCPLCHPEIAQLKEPPVISPEYLARVTHALQLKQRVENNASCPLYRSRIQFVNEEAVTKAGIDVEPAQERSISESISANGEITYDETRLARVASPLPGTVRHVFKQLGQPVRKGELLALIDAAAVGQAKSDLLDALAQLDLALANHQRLVPLAQEQVIPGKRLIEVENAVQKSRIHVRQAEQSLVNLGLNVQADALTKASQQERSSIVRQLGISPDARLQMQGIALTNNMLPVVATLDGVVIDRGVVAGEFVEATQVLFQLADTRKMWLTFQVSLEDSRYLEEGQSVEFLTDGQQLEVTGQISWISTEVDRMTRTVPVRAIIDNVDGRLRNEAFGVGSIVLRTEPNAIVVSNDAVQWDGSCHVVFVRDKDYFEPSHPKLFHVRPVRIGVRQGESTEIIAGLLPGEVIVSQGAGILRGQLLHGSLGAGCTCGH